MVVQIIYITWINYESFIYFKIGNIKGAFSGLRQFLAIESPLKMPFLFHLKSSSRSEDM